MRYIWLAIIAVIIIAVAFGLRLWNNTQARVVLENPATAIVYGAENAPHVIVEHFDYRCPFCPKMHQIFLEALDSRPDVKLVVRSFPMLGADSETISLYVLAAGLQGKDKQKSFHEALLAAPGSLTPAIVLQIAGAIGIDTEKLVRDANGDVVNTQLDDIYKAAFHHGFRSTPTYFMNDFVYVPIDGFPTVADVHEMLDKVFGPAAHQ